MGSILEMLKVVNESADFVLEDFKQKKGKKKKRRRMPRVISPPSPQNIKVDISGISDILKVMITMHKQILESMEKMMEKRVGELEEKIKKIEIPKGKISYEITEEEIKKLKEYFCNDKTWKEFYFAFIDKNILRTIISNFYRGSALESFEGISKYIAMDHNRRSEFIGKVESNITKLTGDIGKCEDKIVLFVFYNLRYYIGLYLKYLLNILNDIEEISPRILNNIFEEILEGEPFRIGSAYIPEEFVEELKEFMNKFEKSGRSLSRYFQQEEEGLSESEKIRRFVIFLNTFYYGAVEKFFDRIFDNEKIKENLSMIEDIQEKFISYLNYLLEILHRIAEEKSKSRMINKIINLKSTIEKYKKKNRELPLVVIKEDICSILKDLF